MIYINEPLYAIFAKLNIMKLILTSIGVPNMISCLLGFIT